MRLLIILVFAFGLGAASAEPTPLVIDSKVKPRSSKGHIEAVHLEIPTNTSDLREIRLRIVDGMLKTRGRIWTFVGEGDGYILARFYYRGNTTVMRIEYNEQLVQLKYHGAYRGFVCENLVEGVCYKNHRGYYNYTKNLRASILQQLQTTGGD